MRPWPRPGNACGTKWTFLSSDLWFVRLKVRNQELGKIPKHKAPNCCCFLCSSVSAQPPGGNQMDPHHGRDHGDTGLTSGRVLHPHQQKPSWKKVLLSKDVCQTAWFWSDSLTLDWAALGEMCAAAAAQVTFKWLITAVRRERRGRRHPQNTTPSPSTRPPWTCLTDLIFFHSHHHFLFLGISVVFALGLSAARHRRLIKATINRPHCSSSSSH